MKIGDMVVMKNCNYRSPKDHAIHIGIVASWYDSPKNLVEVMWWLRGIYIGKNPILANRIEVISE